MRITILLFTVLLCHACTQDAEHTPDVSAISVDVDTYRFDQDVLALRSDSLNITDSLAQLYKRYPVFAPLVLDQITKLRDESMDADAYAQNVLGFINDNGIQYLSDRLQEKYNNIDALEKHLEKAFKLARYYFPQKQIPDIYYFFSEYGIAHFIFQDKNGEDALGIGLDFYLGSDYPYASIIPNNTSFSKYLTRMFNEEHIVSRTLSTWIEDWKQRPDGSRLLDHMIFEGQKLYILDQLAPHVHDTTIFQCTPDQLTWLEQNELQIWAHFIDENVLFEEQPHIIQRYILPAPFTRGMPKQSPGRTGVYTGYRIVKRFMERNPEVSLEELILIKDPQMIYDKSRYRPR